ncbi:hypothetical protein ACWC3X_40840 [Streptomyces populi]|jgi:hypothetical protein
MRRETVPKKPGKKSDSSRRAPEEMDRRLRPEVRKDIARTWWPDG